MSIFDHHYHQKCPTLLWIFLSECLYAAKVEFIISDVIVTHITTCFQFPSQASTPLKQSSVLGCDCNVLPYPFIFLSLHMSSVWHWPAAAAAEVRSFITVASLSTYFYIIFSFLILFFNSLFLKKPLLPLFSSMLSFLNPPKKTPYSLSTTTHFFNYSFIFVSCH